MLMSEGVRPQAVRRQIRDARPEPPVDARRAAEAVVCSKCGVANASARRFCSQCGFVLWKPCPKCENECPAGESFCGNCGADLIAFEKELVKQHERRLNDIQAMIQRFEFNDAMLGLHALAAGQTHPCLEALHVVTKRLIGQVSAERDRLLQLVESVNDRAGQLLKECAYEAAVKQLESIPAPWRPENVRNLIAESQDKAREVATLKLQLRQREGVDNHQRLAAIRQLLILKPKDAQIRQWAEQLRDHVLKIARRKIQNHEYAKAARLLSELPKSVRAGAVVDAERQATELDFLASELELAPEVTDVVLHAGRRLVQLDAGNKRAEARLREILKRKKVLEANSPGHPIPWVACPKTTPFGIPVEHGGMPRRTRFASAEAEHAFAPDPGRFYAACGLALQGLEHANVALNVLSSDNQSVMSLLRRPIRARPASSAWGLAVGALGIAAVRMVRQDGDRPAIEQCVFVPHPQPLTHPNIKSKQRASVLHTLRVFTACYKIDSAEPVVAQLPAARTLVRYLRVPNVRDKKLRELINYEACHQIPFPLEHVAFDTRLFDLPDLPTGIGQRHAILVAATSDEIDQQRAIYENAEIALYALQCEAVAVHNWVHHEFLQSDAEQLSEQDRQSVVTLHIGHEYSSFIVSSGDGVWFQTTRPAGDDFVKGLVERFQLTHDVARQVLHSPYKAKRMSDVHEQNCRLYANLVSQFPRTLAEARKSLPAVEIRQMLVTGESGRIPGLLRFLRFGR